MLPRGLLRLNLKKEKPHGVVNCNPQDGHFEKSELTKEF